MCTLIVQHRQDPTAPLRVAANRDESLDRAASGPALRVFGRTSVLAPLDVQAGGTWIGVNAHGVFAGITNRFSVTRDPARPSRGALVTRALEAATAEGACRTVAQLQGRTQNGFHLVVADRWHAFILKGDGHHIESRRLEPGTLVVTERSFDGGETAREPLLHARIAALEAAGPTSLERLASLLRVRAEPSFEGSLVFMPELGYGTRSSTLIELGAARHAGRFLHTDGRPDETAYADYTPLITQLFGPGDSGRAPRH